MVSPEGINVLPKKRRDVAQGFVIDLLRVGPQLVSRGTQIPDFEQPLDFWPLNPGQKLSPGIRIAD